MGNCVSSSTHIASIIRVVQASEGRVAVIELPSSQSHMTAGELMLEFPPGHFIAQLNKPDFLASASRHTRPLSADAEVKPDAVYVLFPMPRLRTRITAQELQSFAKLLHLHDRLLAKASHNASKLHVHGLFTTGTRVAPLVEEEQKDVSLHSGADAKEQACPLSIGIKMQWSEQASISYPESSSLMSLCYGPFGVIKPKPWAPVLQTIMESS